jgi:hypothetical protein
MVDESIDDKTGGVLMALRRLLSLKPKTARAENSDRSAPARPDRVTPKTVSRELLLMGVAFGAYYAVRLLVRGSGLEPMLHSIKLFRFEDSLHLDWEIAVQRVFLDHLDWLVHVLNFVYAWGYWLVLLGSLVYLFVRRRSAYRWLRNAIFISGMAGFLVFASFPCAPPRLAPVGIVDTMDMSSSIVEEVARPSALTNENAAMPSFHFGWTLLCAICLATSFRRRISKALTVVLVPAVMGLTIVVTGNHYILDAVAGGAICLVALAIVALPSRWPARKPYELQRV